MEKEKILETIKSIQKGCDVLAKEGIPCVFAVGHDNAGLHLSSSIPVLKIPFFVCDVVRNVCMVQEQEQTEEEMKKNGSNIVPLTPKGEA